MVLYKCFEPTFYYVYILEQHEKASNRLRPPQSNGLEPKNDRSYYAENQRIKAWKDLAYEAQRKICREHR